MLTRVNDLGIRKIQEDQTDVQKNYTAHLVDEKRTRDLLCVRVVSTYCSPKDFRVAPSSLARAPG